MWIWILITIIFAYLVYYFLSGDIRKASKIIAYSLNIKLPIVIEFIGAIRKDSSPALGKATRQRYYCSSVIRAHGNIEELSSLVKVFYIYQLLKNPHVQNVQWWASRMKDSGFDVEISATERQTFEIFFEVEHSGFKEFAAKYNEMLI